MPTSKPELLAKARSMAENFVKAYMNDDMVGLVFLGALSRGYFDEFADIDIGLFTRQSADSLLRTRFLRSMGLKFNCRVGTANEF